MQAEHGWQNKPGHQREERHERGREERGTRQGTRRGRRTNKMSGKSPRENQESMCPKWLGYIGIRSWGHAQSEAQRIQKFRVEGRERSPERSQDSVSGTWEVERACHTPPCHL